MFATDLKGANELNLGILQSFQYKFKFKYMHILEGKARYRGSANFLGLRPRPKIMVGPRNTKGTSRSKVSKRIRKVKVIQKDLTLFT